MIKEVSCSNLLAERKTVSLCIYSEVVLPLNAAAAARMMNEHHAMWLNLAGVILSKRSTYLKYSTESILRAVSPNRNYLSAYMLYVFFQSAVT